MTGRIMLAGHLRHEVAIHGVHALPLFLRQPREDHHGIMHGFILFFKYHFGLIGKVFGGNDLGLIFPRGTEERVFGEAFGVDRGMGGVLAGGEALCYEGLRVGSVGVVLGGVGGEFLATSSAGKGGGGWGLSEGCLCRS